MCADLMKTADLLSNSLESAYFTLLLGYLTEWVNLMANFNYFYERSIDMPFKVVRNDIIKMKVDAIVNPTNRYLLLRQ